jgi:hypothetical protein
MDKHERRRLRANDQRIGKIRDELAGSYRNDIHVRDKRFLYEAIRAYTPCAGRLLSLLRRAEHYGAMRIVKVDGHVVRLWLEEYAPWGRRRGWHDELPDYLTIYYILEERIEGDLWENNGRLMVWGGPIGDGLDYYKWRRMQALDYVYDPFNQRIDVKASLKKFQTMRDADFIREIGPSFFRTTERTALFRGELEAASRRWRAIHDCKHIKEELMAAVWHPRRVETLLETHGWAAYNNLLGEE